MRRGLLIAGFMLLLWQTATAHEFPATRRVYLQTENDKFGILVTWTSPTGGATQVGAALAALPAASKRAARANMRHAATTRALRGLNVTVNGRAISWKQARAKLLLEPGERGRQQRHGVMILWSKKIQRGDQVVVTLEKNEHLHGGARWVNKCKNEACGHSKRANKNHTTHALVWR